MYNAGERVEGYTSLGFMWLGALFLRLGIPPIAGWKAASLVAAAAAVVGAAKLERFARGGGLTTPTNRRSFRRSRRSFCSRSPPSHTGRSGRSMMVFGGCSWGLVLVLRNRGACVGRVGPGFRGRALSRSPEGAPLFAVATSRSRYASGRRRPDLGFLRRYAGNVAIVTVTVAAHLAWRYSFYGDWRPNTYYAKVTGGSEQIFTGLQYAGKLALALPVLVLALAVPLLEFARAGEKPRRRGGRLDRRWLGVWWLRALPPP